MAQSLLHSVFNNHWKYYSIIYLLYMSALPIVFLFCSTDAHCEMGKLRLERKAPMPPETAHHISRCGRRDGVMNPTSASVTQCSVILGRSVYLSRIEPFSFVRESSVRESLRLDGCDVLPGTESQHCQIPRTQR